MASGTIYRLSVRAFAVESTWKGRIGIEVPEGELVLRVEQPLSADRRIADVIWNGRRYLMFTDDLVLRAEPIISRLPKREATYRPGTARLRWTL